MPLLSTATLMEMRIARRILLRITHKTNDEDRLAYLAEQELVRSLAVKNDPRPRGASFGSICAALRNLRWNWRVRIASVGMLLPLGRLRDAAGFRMYAAASSSLTVRNSF